jgi:hypothetical protein
MIDPGTVRLLLGEYDCFNAYSLHMYACFVVFAEKRDDFACKGKFHPCAFARADEKHETNAN